MRKIESYFSAPKAPKKRGRPRKKKKGRPPQKHKKERTQNEKAPSKKQSMVNIDNGQVIDLTCKQSDNLQASLEGVIAKTNRSKVARVNWDTPENAKLRQRICDSWLQKNDLYSNKTWSFGKFCLSTGIDRNVLQRFLAKQKTNCPPTKRGRKSLLSESVMRHICEG